MQTLITKDANGTDLLLQKQVSQDSSLQNNANSQELDSISNAVALQMSHRATLKEAIIQTVDVTEHAYSLDTAPAKDGMKLSKRTSTILRHDALRSSQNNVEAQTSSKEDIVDSEVQALIFPGSPQSSEQRVLTSRKFVTLQT